MFAKIFTLCLVIASTQAFFVQKAVKNVPEVEFCLPTSTDWISGLEINIAPWPVVVAEGAIFTLDGQVELLQAITAGSSIRLELKLVTALGDLPIPCLPIEDIEIGSCSYEVQTLLDDLNALEDFDCASLTPADQACALPLMPGIYAEGGPPIEITLPEIPAALLPFLRGKIKANIIGIDENGNENICLNLLIEIGKK